MMWLMMLPCILLPVIFIVVAGKGIGSLTGSFQWIMPIAIMIGIHVLMMKFMHGHGDKLEAVKEKTKTEDVK
jgi:hypothetical protein